MNKIICIVLLSCNLMRYLAREEEDRSPQFLKFCLMSAVIQTLMIYPVLFLKMGLDEISIFHLDFTSPVENKTGVLMPSLILFSFPFLFQKVYTISFNNLCLYLGVFAVVIIFSFFSPYSVSTQATSIAIITYFQIIVSAVICISYLDCETFIYSVWDALRIILYVELVVVITFLFFHITFFQHIFLSDLEFDNFHREGISIARAYGTFIQPNRLGGWIAFTSVFYYACYLSDYMKKRSLYMLLFCIILLILSQSRSAILATGTSLLFLLLSSRYKVGLLSLPKLVGYVMLFSFLVYIFVNIPLVHEMFFESDTDDMTDARLEHYEIAAYVAKTTNFIGVGLNNCTHYMYYRIGGFNQWLLMHAIHNIHLIILVEFGLAGFVCWMMWIAYNFIVFIKNVFYDIFCDIICNTFIGMLIVVIIHGMSDFLYMHYQYAFLMALFFIYKTSIVHEFSKTIS